MNRIIILGGLLILVFLLRFFLKVKAVVGKFPIKIMLLVLLILAYVVIFFLGAYFCYETGLFLGSRVGYDKVKTIDRNNGGKIDTWEYYKEGQLVRLERDINHDGNVDTVYEYKFIRGKSPDKKGEFKLYDKAWDLGIFITSYTRNVAISITDSYGRKTGPFDGSEFKPLWSLRLLKYLMSGNVSAARIMPEQWAKFYSSRDGSDKILTEIPNTNYRTARPFTYQHLVIPEFITIGVPAEKKEAFNLEIKGKKDGIYILVFTYQGIIDSGIHFSKIMCGTIKEGQILSKSLKIDWRDKIPKIIVE